MSEISNYSVKTAFAEATVLLTGASGYVGRIILEQLIRICPDVKTVFVVFRDKRNKSAKERLDDLLSSGLFHMIWESPALRKIKLLKGDVHFERLGLDGEDLTNVIENTTHVIHCAADVGLVESIQKTLQSNYYGVKNVLELCKEMTHLNVYTHISTSYVNINHPHGATVKEEIYPLMHGDQEASHVDIVNELSSLSDKDAELKAEILMERWNFPNTYCFGKNLAEKLVSDYCSNFRCVIVRPSLVAGLMGDPYPGYIDNLAGAASIPIAFAIGFYTRNSSNWKATSITDVIPGDLVASTVLMASAFATASEKSDSPLIFQSGSSTSYPLTNAESYASGKELFTEEPPPYCLLLRGYQERPFDYKPDERRVKAERRILSLKVKSVSLLLRLRGKGRLAQRLETGWKAWKYADQEHYDLNLSFSIKNTAAAYALLDPDEKGELKCIFTQDLANWSRYSRTYCCGVKALLLKSPIIKFTDHDFVQIPNRDPPICLEEDGKNKPPRLPLEVMDGGEALNSNK